MCSVCGPNIGEIAPSVNIFFLIILNVFLACNGASCVGYMSLHCNVLNKRRPVLILLSEALGGCLTPSSVAVKCQETMHFDPVEAGEGKRLQLNLPVDSAHPLSAIPVCSGQIGRSLTCRSRSGSWRIIREVHQQLFMEITGRFAPKGLLTRQD